jgi:hypothetical protein
MIGQHWFHKRLPVPTFIINAFFGGSVDMLVRTGFNAIPGCWLFLRL